MIDCNLFNYPLFLCVVTLLLERLNEPQTRPEKFITIWHLAIWEEINGIIQDIFIMDSSCRILFNDGINIYVPIIDKNLLQRLKNARGKLVNICKTDNPVQRYLLNFNQQQTGRSHSTSIHRKSNEEIDALKVLNRWQSNQVARKKPWANQPCNQQQLFTWMGGNNHGANEFFGKKYKICKDTPPLLDKSTGGASKTRFFKQ
ncbi:Uncharacterised protein [uncultured archaeon]|nr:Uncharacterised protein [uncultured archaeon]